MSEAKLQGRRLPKVFSSLRSFRRPCSGRMGPVPYFCGGEKVSASAWGDVVEEKVGQCVRGRLLRLRGPRLLFWPRRGRRL